MDKYYSFQIPKPCHEDWDLMTPTAKGRYCESCVKTVIDFTVMNQEEISDFLMKNQGKKICGHVKKSQLDSIHIKIPVRIFDTIPFAYRSFLMALLIVMGTTLLSCKDQQGNKHKIDHIEVVDTLLSDTEEVPVTGGFKSPNCSASSDSIPSNLKNETSPINQEEDEIIILDGEIVVGEIDLIPSKKDELDFYNIEEVPEFPNTPKELNQTEKQLYFKDQLSKHIQSNLKKNINTGMKGIVRAYARFVIDSTGQISDVQVNSQHPLQEAEIRRVLSLLPIFKPGKHNGKVCSVMYTISPVEFYIE